MKRRGVSMIVLGVAVMMGIAIGLLKFPSGRDGRHPMSESLRESHNSRASGAKTGLVPRVDVRVDHAKDGTPLTKAPGVITVGSYISQPASSSSPPQKELGQAGLSGEKEAKMDIADASALRGQTAQTSLSPGTTASDSEMIYLCFGLEDRKLNLQTQSVVNGNMKLPPVIASADGFYHRILSESGEILAQGITREPRMLYYDYPNPDGSGKLMGGVLMQSNVQFAVRYPLIAGMDRIEFFSISRTADLSQLSAKGDNYCGSFKLNIPAR
jgi:hypothetical protein